MGRVRSVALAVALVIAGGFGYVAGSGHLLAPQRAVAADDCRTFAETGKQVCGRFLEYWNTNGGLAQQGLPISNTFEEKSSVDGKTYTVQYFERAIFEAHPEKQRPYDVLLSLVGSEAYARRYPSGQPQAGTPLAPGQTFVLKASSGNATFDVTVLNVRRLSEIGKTKAKGVFIVIDLREKNLGSEPSSPRSFKIRDQQGRVFSRDLDGILAGIPIYKPRPHGNNNIQPTLSDEVYEVFDVATDASSFTIEP